MTNAEARQFLLTFGHGRRSTDAETRAMREDALEQLLQGEYERGKIAGYEVAKSDLGQAGHDWDADIALPHYVARRDRP